MSWRENTSSTTAKGSKPSLSMDGILCALRGRRVLRTSGFMIRDRLSGSGPSRRAGGCSFELAKPVAAAADVEDVAAVQQPVEDRGGKHLVAGEHAGPFRYALVRGDED